MDPNDANHLIGASLWGPQMMFQSNNGGQSWSGAHALNNNALGWRCAEFAKSNNIDLNEIADVVKVLDKFKDAHPWYKRWQLSRNLNADDALKARLRRYYRQVTYTVFEFIGFCCL